MELIFLSLWKNKEKNTWKWNRNLIPGGFVEFFWRKKSALPTGLGNPNNEIQRNLVFVSGSSRDKKYQLLGNISLSFNVKSTRGKKSLEKGKTGRAGSSSRLLHEFNSSAFSVCSREGDPGRSCSWKDFNGNYRARRWIQSPRNAGKLR